MPSITAITLFVDDLPAASAFYGEVLGLPQVHSDQVSAVFRFDDVLVNLLLVAAAGELVEPLPVGGRHDGVRGVFTIGVSDVDRRAAEPVARGVVLVNGPVDRPWGIRTASFADPAGHLWEVSAPLAALPPE